MKEYEPNKIEKKWQKHWEKKKLFKAEDFSKKPKLFLLVEFPYPSGDGLHVGHCRSYTAMDVIARKRRMQGYNVLYPMGWDAFGLPTENYAIKTGIHPKKATKENTDTFREQEKAMGFSFDWQREVNTTDPDYYKWTQWIFLKLFENGLAYKAKMPINWCTSCKIGLANEEVVEGKCERCGGGIERREKEQWMLKITKYAERLINDLDLINFPKRVVALQKDWIGRSEGYEANFRVGKADVKVFTTRIDTIFGCTYLVLSPEHPALKELEFLNKGEVEKYIKEAKGKLERERLAEQKEKTGIKIEGVMALNPANGKEIPVFVADYVLMDYGTGAIMAVPAHDQRDLDFAVKYNLEVIEVVKGKFSEKAYEGEGVLINSGEFNGFSSQEAKQRIAQKIGAQKRVYYKLRDWVFSRQRYWGEPIPMILCENCGWVPGKDLPVELPDVKNYEPTEKGDSPLAGVEDWVNVKCPKCKGKAKRETDVMPNWAGSNWYFLRYCDPRNKKEFVSKEKLKYWMGVDWYNGGMEHTTLHLLYSRFIYKFLWDINQIPRELGPEPYKKRTSHGLILAEGGVKMSKSKGNVINPTEVIEQYGADTLRVYEMFMGPFNQAIAWDTKGIKGARRFIEKVWSLASEKVGKDSSLKKSLQKTIKKVSEDIENMKFNTAVSALMEFINEWQKGMLSKEDFADFLKIFAVFCPHAAEELWEKSGNRRSILKEQWPCYDKSLIEQGKIDIIVQVNGKLREKIEVEKGLLEREIKEKALASENVKKHLKGEIKKVVFVKDKLINFVV